MISFLLEEATDTAAKTTIFNTLVNYIKKFSNLATLEYLLYGSIALLVLTIVITWIRTSATYESKLLSKVKKLNKYLAKKQNIDDSNLVEFNDKMKTVPKVVRHNWQEYMLNRDKPSKYLNCGTCIELPTRVSAFSSSIRISRIFISIICFLTFILMLGNFYDETGYSAYLIFFQVLIVPILLFVLGNLFIAFLNARHTAVMSDLYFNFQQFEKNLDRACKTLPEVIDYEILFTKKEIKDNIPALQEYLDKAEAINKAKKELESITDIVGENYDFEELGVDSSLLLERAMKESEKYLNVKRNFSERIRAKEQEKVNYQKNFDEVTKDFERKAQASREIINSVSDQINQTTVKIEANYLKKKLNEEQARYQQYEKDYDVANTRFQKEQEDIQYEIDKFNEEIKRRKDQATENMLSEGKTYVNKIYGQVTETVIKQNQPLIDEMQAQIDSLKEEIEKLNNEISEKDTLLSDKDQQIAKKEQELNVNLAELEAVKTLREYVTTVEFRERLAMSKKELKNASKEDRKEFKRVRREMKQTVRDRVEDGSSDYEEPETIDNVTVVTLQDTNPVPVENTVEENEGVQVVRLPDDTPTVTEEPHEENAQDNAQEEVQENVTVVKLPEVEEAPAEVHDTTYDEVSAISKDIEEVNEKLRESQSELSAQIGEAPETDENINEQLREKMVKLNKKTKEVVAKQKSTRSKAATTSSRPRVKTTPRATKTTTAKPQTEARTTFKVPKIKK